MKAADLNIKLEVDPADKNTPDEWVARHPQLIRLTGAHPLNAEPGLDVLFEQGFITPSPLHYVRNHGKVPRIDPASHKLSIEGLVNKPCSLSIEELKQMPAIRIPVTITCDGNRRKELNMEKHSQGFGWGAGAISTSIWKGVPLHHLIYKVCNGLKESAQGKDLFVCFDGPPRDVEELAKGSYGTR